MDLFQKKLFCKELPIKRALFIKNHCHIDNTPSMLEGVPRDAYDFNPRVQLQVAFEAGEMSNEEAVAQFSKKYITDQPLVQAALTDLVRNKASKVVKARERAKDKEELKQRSYADID